jgi:hypothetical protein
MSRHTQRGWRVAESGVSFDVDRRLQAAPVHSSSENPLLSIIRPLLESTDSSSNRPPCGAKLSSKAPSRRELKLQSGLKKD